MGHPQRGFMVSLARGTVFQICLLSFTAIVMTLPTLNTLLQRDSMAIPILLSPAVGISLEMMPHSSSKRSTSIVLVLSPEPLVQLSLVQAVFSIGTCPATSTAV